MKFLFLAALAVATPLTFGQATPHYAVIKKIKIGGEGGWDYLTAYKRLLFISRGTHVMVLDLSKEKVVADIPNTQGVHGIAIAPNLNKGYISNGRDDSVTVFNLKTLKEIKRVKVGDRPDAIIFDAASKRVFTFNAGSLDASAIDATKDKLVGSVKLEGKPEFPQVDGKGTLFVNIEDKSEIQKFNTRSLKVTGKWPVAPGEEPSGAALDLKDNLLFSTCDNNILAISNTKLGKLVGTAKIGAGPDAAAFDPTYGLAFSSNGQDGTLTVVRASKGFPVVQTLKTQVSARTMTLDPKTHRIYLIAADIVKSSTPAQGRPKLVPGSACILVVAPSK